MKGGLWAALESLGLRHPRERAKGKGRAWSFASVLVTPLHLPVGIFLGQIFNFHRLEGTLI